MEERLLEQSDGNEEEGEKEEVVEEDDESTTEVDGEELTEEEDEEGSTMAQLKFVDPILPDENNHEVDSIEAVDDAEDDPLELFLERYGGVWDEERTASTRLHDGREEAGDRKPRRSNGQRRSERLSGGSALELRVNPLASGDDSPLPSSGFAELPKPVAELGQPSTNGKRGMYADEQDLLTLQLATRTPGAIDRRVVHNVDSKSQDAGAGIGDKRLEEISRESPPAFEQVLGDVNKAETFSRHIETCSCGRKGVAGPRVARNTGVWLDHVINPPDPVAGSEGRGGAPGKLTPSEVVVPPSAENFTLWKHSSCAPQVSDGKISDVAAQCSCRCFKMSQKVSGREAASETGPQQTFVGERKLLELNLFPESEARGLEPEEKISFGSAGDNGFSNGKVMRDVMNRSTSKGSVRTGTSLERQYSTGSTSTVESPALFVKDRKERGRSRAAANSARAAGNSPRLSFSFPGWRVDIARGENCTSVVSHRSSEQAVEASGMPASKRAREGSDASAKTDVQVPLPDSNLGERSPVCELPDEILQQVMRRLRFKDLCSASQACKRWHDIGLQNELWEPFLGVEDHGLCSDASSDVLPRWVCKKSLCMSEGVRERFNVFSKGYDFLRQALHFWWDEGSSNSKYSSKRMHSLIRKLTENDWSLLYEALGVTFTDRTDRIANELQRSLRPLPDGTGSKLSVHEIRPERVKNGQGGRPDYDTDWRSRAREDASELDCEKGKRLWEALLKSWKRYKCWLQLIFTHCQDLNQCVSVERARSPNLKIQTPTLFDKGLICFRSQVVLKYGLRNLLQAGFMLLTDADIRDFATEHDVDLLRSCHHFLQELDVMDDCTLPERSHTQTKLRHRFPTALSVNCKLALHMKDKWNQL